MPVSDRDGSVSVDPSAQGTQWREVLTWRFILVAALASLFYLAVLAIPTAIIANPLFRRMTPPTVWSWTFWITPGMFFGPLVASYVIDGPWRQCSLLERKTLAGGLLSFLAVGCPICNKVVVAILGVSGAVSYFAPIQPILGGISVVLLAYAFWLRLRPPADTGDTGQLLPRGGI